MFNMDTIEDARRYEYHTDATVVTASGKLDARPQYNQRETNAPRFVPVAIVNDVFLPSLQPA